MLVADIPTPPAIVRTADSFDLATGLHDPEVTGNPQRNARTDAHLDLGLAPGHCPTGQPGETVNCGPAPDKDRAADQQGPAHSQTTAASPALPGGMRLRVRTENKTFPTGQVGQGALGGLEQPF